MYNGYIHPFSLGMMASTLSGLPEGVPFVVSTNEAVVVFVEVIY